MDLANWAAREEAELLVWRAGRERAAGIPAARDAQRREERDAALASLDGKLADEIVGEAWSRYLFERIQSPSESGSVLADEHWCRAARVVGRLRLYSFAPRIASELDDGRPPLRRAAAREVLHELYGRWFELPAEVTPFLEEVQPGPGTLLLLDALHSDERRSREVLFRALRHDVRGALEALNHLDPAVRRGSARLLGEALGSQTAEADAIVVSLFAALEEEVDPGVFEALLDALLVSLENAAADDPRVLRLHGVVSLALRDELNGRQLPLARVLVRLPLTEAEGSRDPRSSGHWRAVEDVGVYLTKLLRSGDERPEAETDALLVALSVLQAACDRAQGMGIAEELHQTEASRIVFGILQDATAPEDVRIAAAAAVAPFTLREDWRLFTEVLLYPETTPGLAHALLGLLPSILHDFEPEDPESPEVLARVAALTGSSDPDLRRRALSLLADPELEPLVRILDAEFLVVRLESEEVPDLSAQLLELVRRFGGPDLLEPVLRLERFDELVSVDAGRVASIASMLQRLGNGRPGPTAAAARRLAAVIHDPTRLARLQQALGLVAGLPPEAAEALGPPNDQEISGWAWELHASGIGLSDAVSGGDSFIERLVNWHLPGAAEFEATGSELGRFGPGRRAHLRAVLSGEILLAGEDPVNADATEVEQSFAEALAYAPEASDTSFHSAVLRDRARFRAARGDYLRALSDFRLLSERKELPNSDLRRAIEVLSAISGSGLPEVDLAAIRTEAVDFNLRLVERSSWTADHPSSRMEDLRNLVASLDELQDPKRRARICALFDDLPTSLPENGPDYVPPSEFWSGLVQSEGTLTELTELAARACLTPIEAEIPGGADAGSTPPESDGPPPEDGPEEESGDEEN